ncbi:MAG: hypothetical protein P8J27_07550 [Mariniblastus sp.]|nr:hypothetical protein [Mariniblastus sp.]
MDKRSDISRLTVITGVFVTPYDTGKVHQRTQDEPCLKGTSIGLSHWEYLRFKCVNGFKFVGSKRVLGPNAENLDFQIGVL